MVPDLDDNLKSNNFVSVLQIYTIDGSPFINSQSTYISILQTALTDTFNFRDAILCKEENFTYWRNFVCGKLHTAREGKLLYLLVHSAVGHGVQGWTRKKSGAWNSVWV